METATTTLVLVLSIVIGLVNCFCGYRLQRLWIGAVCFLVGLLGSYAVCAVLLQEVPVWVSLLVGLACGAVFAAFSLKLFLVGVFLYAGGSTYWACRLLIAEPVWAAVVIGLLVALPVGFLAVKFTRVAMICSTALSGGLSAAKSALLLIPAAADSLWLPLAAGAALAVAGVFVQYRSDAHARRRRQAHDEAKTAKAAPPAAMVDGEPVPERTGRPPIPEPLPLDLPAEAPEEENKT